ncbi:MAG: hypothetical protein ACO2O5_04220 [Candidatus Caldipriscus sp.]
MPRPDDKEVLRGVYMWIMKSEDGKEWEKVAIILVSNPLVVEWIEEALDLEDDRRAVYIVASLLGLRWGFPPYWADDEMAEVREEWLRSRIIRIWEYEPEKKGWRWSSYLERLGWDDLRVFDIY